ncbi:MAG: UDP-glucose 4-epimerase GalE [Candidatus Contendobacter sp.]|nr:UDP-glucose 4-epimerase GalE [Candidatus Contendobacter sp.]
MNILLTGGTGYIGSHTAVVLAQAGHRMVLLDNYSNSQPEVGDRLAQILGQPVTQIEGDVRDTARLIETLRQYAIEAVIHFAGLKAVGESVARPIDYYAHNVQGTISLLQAMQATGVKILVFSSSATVYGNPQYLPIDEQHPLSATNSYGRSKLHIEAMLSDVAHSDDAWRIACLRYFNPVGAHESGLIGENPQGAPNNLMPFIAQVASGEQPWLNVYGNDYPTPDGTGVRDYIHVMDLAEGHQAALAVLSAGLGVGSQPANLITVNLGTGQGYSVLEMVKTFEAVSGRVVPYQIAPRRPGDIAACYAQVSKAADVLGWQARRGLQEMCASAWNWQVQSRPGAVAKARCYRLST